MLFARAELGRSKLRFGGLTLGAGLLVFVLLFQQSLLTAVLDGMAGVLKNQSGAIIVFTKDAHRNLGGGSFTTQQVTQVQDVPGVGDIGPLGLALLSYRTATSDTPTNIAGIGYQMGKPGTPTVVRSGRLPQAPDEVAASAEGAQGRFAIGDTLTFDPGAVKLKVVGLTEGALLSVGPALWVPWESHVALLTPMLLQGVAVLPAVLAVNPEPGVPVAQVIEGINKVPDLEAMTSAAAAEAAPGRRPIETAFLTVMILCYVVVGVVIGFFFLTITLQKEQSITMLRAVGATAGYLIGSLLYEVAVVMTGGLIIGVLVIYLVKPLIRTSVIISIDPAGIAVTVLPVLAVALAGTLPPIRRMLRVDPNAVVSRPALGSVR